MYFVDRIEKNSKMVVSLLFELVLLLYKTSFSFALRQKEDLDRYEINKYQKEIIRKRLQSGCFSY